ncbi:hypothetical protein BDW42DRAFT_16262 [Aspergillus taichungensis]|uniref:Uncharacterized protein n=1 Tax=Aspergillus taichungensis TaxID=482145 RepID=A0A2J5HIH9_9EURO|nr:hypothetical protein BDW42DRAFT_16262 [Aspergillus taichungensis]
MCPADRHSCPSPSSLLSSSPCPSHLLGERKGWRSHSLITIFNFFFIFSFFTLSRWGWLQVFCPLSRGVRAYTYDIGRSTGTDRRYAYDDAYAGSSIASPSVYPSTPYLSIH